MGAAAPVDRPSLPVDSHLPRTTEDIGMLQASWSDLSESVDRCFEAACFQPISIGNNGKPTHALLSIEE